MKSKWWMRCCAVDDPTGVVHAIDEESHVACGACCHFGTAFVSAPRESIVTCIQCNIGLVREDQRMVEATLTDAQRSALSRDRCADCGGLLSPGPTGGGSMNYICGNRDCGSAFNYSLSWERISPPQPRRPHR